MARPVRKGLPARRYNLPKNDNAARIPKKRLPAANDRDPFRKAPKGKFGKKLPSSLLRIPAAPLILVEPYFDPFEEVWEFIRPQTDAAGLPLYPPNTNRMWRLTHGMFTCSSGTYPVRGDNIFASAGEWPSCITGQSQNPWGLWSDPIPADKTLIGWWRKNTSPTITRYANRARFQATTNRFDAADRFHVPANYITPPNGLPVPAYSLRPNPNLAKPVKRQVQAKAPTVRKPEPDKWRALEIPFDSPVPRGRPRRLPLTPPRISNPNNPEPTARPDPDPVAPPWSPPVAPHARQAPPARTKENKGMTKVQSLSTKIFKALDGLSEKCDVVDVLFDALPKPTQAKWKAGHQRVQKGLSVDKFGQYGIDGCEWKLAALYFNWHKIDIDDAVKGLIKNYVEDKYIGAGEAAKSGSRSRNRQRRYERSGKL